MYLRTHSATVSRVPQHNPHEAQDPPCGCAHRRSSGCACGDGLLGNLARAAKEEALTTVADADGLTGVAPQVASNVQLMKGAVHHAALHIRNTYNIDLAPLVPAIRLIATSKGFGEYPRHTVNHLLRQAPARLNGKTVTVDQIEAEVQKRTLLPPTRGGGVWCTVNPRSGTRVIVGLGKPPDPARTSLHEAMHALSNRDSGLPQVTMLSEGGAEYYARQAARAMGVSYEKQYRDLEAIYGKLVTDFGDQSMAAAFFGNGLPAFEGAFEKQYGAGRLQDFIDNLTPASLSRATAMLKLDYETMDQNRP